MKDTVLIWKFKMANWETNNFLSEITGIGVGKGNRGVLWYFIKQQKML